MPKKSDEKIAKDLESGIKKPREVFVGPGSSDDLGTTALLSASKGTGKKKGGPKSIRDLTPEKNPMDFLIREYFS